MELSGKIQTEMAIFRPANGGEGGWNVSSYLLVFYHAIIIINFGNEQTSPTQETQEHPPRPHPTPNHPPPSLTSKFDPNHHQSPPSLRSAHYDQPPNRKRAGRRPPVCLECPTGNRLHLLFPDLPGNWMGGCSMAEAARLPYPVPHRQIDLLGSHDSVKEGGG